MRLTENDLGDISGTGWKPYESCCHDDTTVMRYGFDTPDELLKRLKAVCVHIDDETISSVVAGTFRVSEANREAEDQATIEIPEFIYAF